MRSVVFFEPRSRARLLGLLGLSLSSVPACGPSTPPTGSGGGVASGGLPGSGGVESGSGGVLASGGNVGTGGGATTGGAPATGGAGATTSSGGETASGGSPSGGGTGLTLVEPIERSASSYVLEFGDYLFEVDPTQGARIVEFSLAGTNLLRPVMLTTDAEPWLTGGATFWVSPQVTWSWPPVPEIDTEPYEAMVTGSTIEVASASATIEASTIHIEKAFSADLVGEGVNIVYEIHNDGAAPVSYAPWEISRHARGGMTFWPGARAPGPDEEWEFEPTLVEGVYYWDDSASAASDVKVSADGEGWVAHVEGQLLFVKSWTPVPAADIALNQGEVELYLGNGFVEVEVQGPDAEIATDGQSTFEVTWYVRTLPVGTDVSVGSADLLAAVDAILP